MGEPTMVERVQKLEKTVESLAALPGEIRSLGRRLVRVEARTGALELQIVELRTEMRGEFSAIRSELAQAKHDILEVIEISSRATQSMFDEMSSRFVGLSNRVAGVEQRLGALEKTVDDMRGTMATSEEMRRLHHEVIRRIDALARG